MKFYNIHTISAILVYIIMALCVFIFVSLYELGEYTYTRRCNSFSSHKDAQAALKVYPRLDGNKDGIACNGLK